MKVEKIIENTEKSLFDLAEEEVFSVIFKIVCIRSNNRNGNSCTKMKKESWVFLQVNSLDEKLGGLHKSDLIILAGRPSMGKTALAANIAFNASQTILSRQEKSL